MVDIKLIIILIFSSALLNFLIIYLNKSFLFFHRNQTQDIHQGNISRLGGISIILLFFLYGFYEKYLSFSYIFFFIILIPSLLEDINFRIHPLLRLFLILFTSFLLVYNQFSLPQFDFGYLNIIFNNHYFQIIFYTLAIATVTNGQNIIDGTNGLSAFTSLTIFTSILILGLEINDEIIINISLTVISLVIGFLFFNFPFGKIFLGDTGSYFLGILSSYLVIEIFAKNPNLPSWSAVTILFYPTLEVLFSYFRKLNQKKSPFFPDNKHLHLKIYYLISSHRPYSRLYNALVAPFLSSIWLSPLALLPLSLHSPHLSLLILLFLTVVYLFFYFSIPNPKE